VPPPGSDFTVRGHLLTPRQDLRRAVALFDIEWRLVDSPFVKSLWRTNSVPRESFISTASSYWEFCVWTARGETHVTIRGPSRAPNVVPIPQDTEFFGIRFNPGAVLRPHPAARLVDEDIMLPASVGNIFRLNNEPWEIPTFENADVFLERLVCRGLLVRDPLVQRALQGRLPDLSRRSIERRMKSVTGLSLGAIRQIERAHAAAVLLDQGVSILDTVLRTGYADQAHLTRSLKRFIGQTPSDIVSDVV
jgi:AraC-like DNA-binding protein